MIDARQHVVGKYSAFDFEKLTIDDTVGGIGLTAAKLASNPRPKKVIITAEDAQFRYTIDGTTVTSLIGHLVNPMDSIVLEGHSQLNGFKAIRKGSTSAVLQVTYLR